MTEGINQLPKSILGLIFSYTPADFSAISRVCKRWHASTTPQLCLEAQFYGMKQIREECFKELSWEEIYGFLLEGRKPLEQDDLETQITRRARLLENIALGFF